MDLTPVIHNHLQNEPSLLFLDSPAETHEPALGLQHKHLVLHENMQFVTVVCKYIGWISHPKGKRCHAGL